MRIWIHEIHESVIFNTSMSLTLQTYFIGLIHGSASHRIPFKINYSFNMTILDAKLLAYDFIW